MTPDMDFLQFAEKVGLIDPPNRPTDWPEFYQAVDRVERLCEGLPPDDSPSSGAAARTDSGRHFYEDAMVISQFANRLSAAGSTISHGIALAAATAKAARFGLEPIEYKDSLDKVSQFLKLKECSPRYRRFHLEELVKRIREYNPDVRFAESLTRARLEFHEQSLESRDPRPSPLEEWQTQLCRFLDGVDDATERFESLGRTLLWEIWYKLLRTDPREASDKLTELSWPADQGKTTAKGREARTPSREDLARLFLFVREELWPTSVLPDKKYSDTTLRDWSKLVLTVFTDHSRQRRNEDCPAWLVVPALREVGFDKDQVRQVETAMSIRNPDPNLASGEQTTSITNDQWKTDPQRRAILLVCHEKSEWLSQTVANWKAEPRVSALILNIEELDQLLDALPNIVKPGKPPISVVAVEESVESWYKDLRDTPHKNAALNSWVKKKPHVVIPPPDEELPMTLRELVEMINGSGG